MELSADNIFFFEILGGDRLFFSYFWGQIIFLNPLMSQVIFFLHIQRQEIFLINIPGPPPPPPPPRISNGRSLKVFHILVAVGTVVVWAYRVLGTGYERGSLSISFRSLYPSLIRNKLPIYCWEDGLSFSVVESAGDWNVRPSARKRRSDFLSSFLFTVPFFRPL